MDVVTFYLFSGKMIMAKYLPLVLFIFYCSNLAEGINFLRFCISKTLVDDLVVSIAVFLSQFVRVCAMC